MPDFGSIEKSINQDMNNMKQRMKKSMKKLKHMKGMPKDGSVSSKSFHSEFSSEKGADGKTHTVSKKDGKQTVCNHGICKTTTCQNGKCHEKEYAMKSQ